MSIDLRRAAPARALVTLLVLSACAESPTATTTGGLGEPQLAAFSETGTGFAVVPLRLSAAEGSESTAWGNLVVFVGTLAPPNPCVGTVELATIAVCGVIHHPGGVNLTGGTLRVQATRDATPVLLEFILPPNPCLTYQVRAAAAPDLGTFGPELPAVQVVFTSEQGEIVSTNPGPPDNPEWVNPGPPNDPGSGVGSQPGPPNAPPNPCLITFAERAG